jgi:hypothetical protein
MTGDNMATPHIRERERLSPLSAQLLHPWRRAEALTRCFLYWMPVTCFPMPAQERKWVMDFVDRFVKAIALEHDLRAEVFLQAETVEAVRIVFVKSAREFSPVLGWSHKPGTALRPVPTREEIEKTLDQQERFDAKGIMPDRCYWFLKKNERKQRESFLGHGGLSICFLKADSNTKPPELPFTEAMRKQQEQLPIRGLMELLGTAFSMKEGFLARSKELLGQGLEDAPGFRGIPFIAAQLSAGDFFTRPAEECDRWFQLFDIYLNESQIDRGIILASRIDLTDLLTELLSCMQSEGVEYVGT